MRLQSETKSVDHLAKGIAKADEVIGRIIKITFTDDVDESQFLQLKILTRQLSMYKNRSTIKLILCPNDSLLSQQWALEKIQAFDAWDVTTGSDTVLLGIIDTN